jgi:pyruvate dehydrogenase E1 component alpha subunit
LGYGLKFQGGDRVSCVFLGDAVAEAGVFLESLNFSALKRLPVLFVCENNLYSVYSPLSVRQPAGRRISDMAAAIGVPAVRGDGNHAEEVYEITAAALSEIRTGSGPRFLEFETYRWREHCGPNFDNNIGYRTETEFLAWKERDPIRHLERKLLTAGVVTDTELSEMRNALAQEIADAFDFAENSPFPEATAASTDVYTSPTFSLS